MDTGRAILFLVSLLALVLAAIVGGVVGQGEYLKLMIGGGAVLGLVYLIFLSTGWIAFAFLYSALSFNIAPVGFSLGAFEISCLLAGLYAVMRCWRHGAFDSGKTSSQFGPFLISLVVFTVYLGFNFLFNKINPVHSETIAWTNAAKTYLWMLGGFILVAVAVLMPRGSWLPKQPVTFLALLLLLGTAVNLVIRIYGILVLGISTVDLGTGEEVAASSIFIPFINLTDNIYILRSLGPACTLFAAVMITSKCSYASSIKARILVLLLIIFGVGASLASMGRAALILGIALPMVVLFLRRRIFLLAVFGALGVVFLFTARMTYEYDEQLVPPSMQRALAMIPGMNMQTARANIDNSSEWRYQLFALSLEDWKQSTRTLLSGRSVFAFTERDAARLAGTDVFSYTMVSALRRGATHNLITDLLVPVGLVGLICYVVVYGSLIRGIIKVRKISPPESEVQDLAVISLVGLSCAFAVACLGGGFLQSLDALGVAAMIVLATREERSNMKTLTEGA